MVICDECKAIPIKDSADGISGGNGVLDGFPLPGIDGVENLELTYLQNIAPDVCWDCFFDLMEGYVERWRKKKRVSAAE